MKFISNKKTLLIGSNGYIGSELVNYLAQLNCNFTTVDYLSRPYNNMLKPDYTCDYRSLNANFLNAFDSIVFLAGHSSVPQSIADPIGCIHNNLLGLIELNEKYDGLLVYASSGSVYNSPGYHYSDENSDLTNPLNSYDFSKVSFDNYMSLEGKNFVGLRFGTVVGSSPNMRWELLLNKMVKDSITNGILNLGNPCAARPVLFIKDLCRAIKKIIDNDRPVNCYYNLCNVNGSMEYFANTVSSYFSSQINHLESSPTYNFMMSTKKFKKNYNFEFENSMHVILKDIKSAL